ncbi:hypothetical protein [Desulfitibacter alkalitolerans]|uniref:hypothetical protein n=1 Tax=Desulfitibacter alkalitolerans TaxID=264641 RepID=UPI0012EB3D80|nr:hypothetical protein [Desulfitibacter alkalitolerans]
MTKNQLTRRKRDVIITIVVWSSKAKKCSWNNKQNTETTQKTADKNEKFQYIPVAKLKQMC